MINNHPPFQGLNIRIPILIPLRGFFFIRGSGLGLRCRGGADATVALVLWLPLQAFSAKIGGLGCMVCLTVWDLGLGVRV